MGARIALLLAVTLFASRALAQDAPPDGPPPSPQLVEARQHIANGEAFANANNFDGALVEFQRAYDLLEGNPSRYIVLFNIGQAHERMFRYDEAITYYQRYLDEGGPQAEDRATVEATMHALEGLLGTVNITANVPTADVWVDQRQVGTFGADHRSIRVPAGIHNVELRTHGYQSAAQQVQVAARNSTDARFTLERLSDYHGLPTTWFWATAGTAAVVAVTGFVLGGVALSMHSDEVRQQMDTTNPNRFAVPDNAHTVALVADILFATAGAFALGALIVAFITDWGGHTTHADDPPTTAPHASLTPFFGPGTGGLSLTGDF